MGFTTAAHIIISIVTIQLSSSHQDPAAQGQSSLSFRGGERKRFREVKSDTQATIQDHRGQDENPGPPGFPGPRSLSAPLSKATGPSRVSLGVLIQGLHRAPWPVHFPYREMEARARRAAGPRPHSPGRTTYGVNT